MWRIVMLVILCMQLVACSAAASSSGKVESTPSVTSTTAEVTPINAAIEKCNLTTSTYVQINDDGHSVLLDGRKDSTYVSGLEITDTTCVLQELGVPGYITLLMGRTRALDGMQREEYDGYKIYWSYHPDDGLDIIIHMK